MSRKKLHLCLISVHGLIRASNLELGRDADTGGQVLYVVELAKALAARPEVAHVDLVTRKINSPQVDAIYSQAIEQLAIKANIVRIEAGGDGYLPKEQLWEHLDSLVDNLCEYYNATGRKPDVLHSHYADAGYVGSRLSYLIGAPLIHTGHSLGRVKRRRLLASGADDGIVEQRYNMTRRLAAEEQTLASSARVITSTHQEIEEQYGLYDFYRPEAMRVIPPGTDLSRFHPPRGDEDESEMSATLKRFLRDPEKPMILALSRADARKNIAMLVHAYGDDKALQERANLVIVMGNRDEIANLDSGAREVFTELLTLIDTYDLYGKVAYPKQHGSDDVPVLYRLATLSGGVFVNPALTEPFGLTLIEAAASGLPIVATEDGGPVDIVRNCHNGLLIDPLEPASISGAISKVIGDWEQWQQRSLAGLQGVREHYVWDAHAQLYMEMISDVIATNQGPIAEAENQDFTASKIDRALFTDLNRSLLGDENALKTLIEHVRTHRKRMKFGINTGLRLDAALRLLRRHQIPEPDFLITSTGTEIHYAPKLTADIAWTQQIEKRWTPKQVRRVMRDIPGVSLRKVEHQSVYKISYLHDPAIAPTIEEISARLYQEDQAVNVIFSHGRYLNIVPIRASKGLAMRYLAAKYGIALERTLAIGGSGADEDMMRGNTLAAIVGNRSHEELSNVAQSNTIYFTEKMFAAGILEAMNYYDFLGSCQAPDPVKGASHTDPEEITESTE
ncbi:MAG: HAD family hydrolase [Granulosicoccus sp.]